MIAKITGCSAVGRAPVLYTASLRFDSGHPDLKINQIGKLNSMRYTNLRNNENLEKCMFDGAGKYDIPILYPETYKGEHDFVSFNYGKSLKSKQGKVCHFFIDDYQFMRVWSNIDTYIPMFQEFDYALTPDFSLYLDYPKAIQIYNHYRKHWVGAYMQMMGCKVIPTIAWSDKESFELCFDGEPEGATVAVSSVGCMKNKESKHLFIDGYKEMVKRLQPETIIFYGQILEECMGNIVRVKAFTDKFKEAKCNGW